MRKGPIILMDVGGTNTRIYFYDDFSFLTEKITLFAPGSFDDLRSNVEHSIKNYLTSERIKLLCVCFAGKVQKQEKIVSITKWREKFDIGKLFDFIRIEKTVFLNDAEAAVLGLEKLANRVNVEIIRSKRNNLLGKPFSLMYLGTGLGTAIFDEKPFSSEFGSLPLSLTPKERKELGVRDNLCIEDIVSGRGLAKITKLLYKENLPPEEISKRILKGDIQEVGKCFTKYLGRAARWFALAFPVGNLFIGGKPTEPFTSNYYEDFLREFLSDKINFWWLSDIAVGKLDSHLDLPFEGLKVLAEKMG